MFALLEYDDNSCAYPVASGCWWRERLPFVGLSTSSRITHVIFAVAYRYQYSYRYLLICVIGGIVEGKRSDSAVCLIDTAYVPVISSAYAPSDPETDGVEK